MACFPQRCKREIPQFGPPLLAGGSGAAPTDGQGSSAKLNRKCFDPARLGVCERELLNGARTRGRARLEVSGDLALITCEEMSETDEQKIIFK